jgi:transcriptional regulator with XRE-family HTH domain
MSRFWKADANRKSKSYAIKRRMGHYRGLTRRQRPLLRKLLKQAREEAKLNQAEAGELLGQDQSFISKIESGRRQVEFIEVEQLARIYRKPLAFFATSDRVSATSRSQKKARRSNLRHFLNSKPDR